LRLRSRARFLTAVLLVVIAAGAIAASPADAIIVHRPGPDFSYQPLNGQGPSAQQLVGANMTYHGGPVMHSNTEYAIFWAPSGFAFPAGYESAIVSYLQNVAVDSGKATNVYSVATQYADGSGRAAYQTTFGGSFDDTTPYPTSGTCNPYTGAVGTNYATCISDARLRSELNSVIAAHGLPVDLATIYFIFLPPNVGQCVQTGAAADCFDREYCAYHSMSPPSNPPLYTSQPYAPVDPVGCGTRQYPNSNSVDDELSSASHEANEVITDPLPPTGWFDTNLGGENGDLCRNTGSFAGDYGTPLGGSPGSFFNQIINTGHYFLQQEWSNAANGGAGGCEQRYNLSGSASGPSSGVAGKRLSFTATGVDGDGGSVTGVDWSFGDSGSASGPTATHVYTAPGTFQVTAQIHNSTGLTATAPHAITISRPSNRFSFGRPKPNKQKGTAKLPVRVPGRGTLKLAGKGLAKQRGTAGRRGTVDLLVKPKGSVKRALDRKGRAAVKAKVTYRPRFGLSRTKTKKLTLVKKR
jgi:hypothetical protein